MSNFIKELKETLASIKEQAGCKTQKEIDTLKLVYEFNALRTAKLNELLEDCEKELARLQEQMLLPSKQRDSFWIDTFLRGGGGGAVLRGRIARLVK